MRRFIAAVASIALVACTQTPLDVGDLECPAGDAISAEIGEVLGGTEGEPTVREALRAYLASDDADRVLAEASAFRVSSVNEERAQMTLHDGGRLLGIVHLQAVDPGWVVSSSSFCSSVLRQ